jgi:hypothetical protein
MKVFKIGAALVPRLVAWMDDLDEKIAQEQVRTGLFFGEGPLDEFILKTVRESLERGKPAPYYGTVGDAYTYSFRPSTVGCQIVVKHEGTGDEIVLASGGDLFGWIESDSD